MKSTKKKILAISGSTKNQSTSLFILKFIAEEFSEMIELDIYNDIATLPHFNPELENENLPDEVQRLRSLIAAADGVLFCTPEYVFSLPGSLKNALEWQVATTLFSGKPVGIIIAAASGEKAFVALDLILTTIEAILVEDAKLLIRGAKGKLNSDGKIRNEETKIAIKKVVNTLLGTIESGENVPTKFAE